MEFGKPQTMYFIRFLKKIKRFFEKSKNTSYETLKNVLK